MRGNATDRFGFTLLELTAVVVLMALITAAVMPGLARRSDAAALAGLVAGLIDLDARARVNASRNDVCFLAMDEQGGQILFNIIRSSESLVLGRVEIPEGTSVRLVEAKSTISFDHSGHTVSYGYEINAGTHKFKIRFNGLTGWHEIEREDGT